MRGQLPLENAMGNQPRIDSRLELHESKKMLLVFVVPKNASGLRAVIEEGPFITDLLFAEDQTVFLIK